MSNQFELMYEKYTKIVNEIHVLVSYLEQFEGPRKTDIQTKKSKIRVHYPYATMFYDNMNGDDRVKNIMKHVRKLGGRNEKSFFCLNDMIQTDVFSELIKQVKIYVNCLDSLKTLIIDENYCPFIDDTKNDKWKDMSGRHMYKKVYKIGYAPGWLMLNKKNVLQICNVIVAAEGDKGILNIFGDVDNDIWMYNPDNEIIEFNGRQYCCDGLTDDELFVVINNIMRNTLPFNCGVRKSFDNGKTWYETVAPDITKPSFFVKLDNDAT